jgi:hypothetical protein
MNRDPQDDGDDNDDYGNQQVTNHLSLRSGFLYRSLLPRRVHMNSTTRLVRGRDPQGVTPRAMP